MTKIDWEKFIEAHYYENTDSILLEDLYQGIKVRLMKDISDGMADREAKIKRLALAARRIRNIWESVGIGRGDEKLLDELCTILK